MILCYKVINNHIVFNNGWCYLYPRKHKWHFLYQNDILVQFYFWNNNNDWNVEFNEIIALIELKALWNKSQKTIILLYTNVWYLYILAKLTTLVYFTGVRETERAIMNAQSRGNTVHTTSKMKERKKVEFSNADRTKKTGWSQVLSKGKQILFPSRLPSLL